MTARYCLLSVTLVLSLMVLLDVSAVAFANEAPGPKEKKDRLDIRGRLMLDGDYYESFWSKEGDNATTDAEVHNARVEFAYDFPKGWDAKLQLDADLDSEGSNFELGSAYLRYKKWDFADITLGKMKEPLGLERNTRADRLLTIERTMMSSALTAGKNWGIHLYNANKHRRWALAMIFEDNRDDDFDEDAPVAITGRYNWYPLNGKAQTLQVGISGSLRDWHENTFQIRERAEVHTGDNVVRSAEFRADSQSILGLEGVWRYKSLLLQAETLSTRVTEVHGPDWDYISYYVMGSYFLTGEQHRFKKGKLRTIRPLGDHGAWELIARYSYLDVRQRGLGSQASVTTLGVNYYFTKQIKLMLAFLHPDISGSVRHADPRGEAVSMRLQFVF